MGQDMPQRMDTQRAPLGASWSGYELFGLRRNRVTSYLDCKEGLYQNQHKELARSQCGHIQDSLLKPHPSRLLTQPKTSKWCRQSGKKCMNQLSFIAVVNQVHQPLFFKIGE
jgi:hypothetical protein